MSWWPGAGAGARWMCLLVGNHDPREATRRAFDFLGPIPSRGRICYVSTTFRSGSWRSTAWSSGGPTATLGEEQFARLDKRLEKRPKADDPGRLAPPADPYRDRPYGPPDAARPGEELAAVISPPPSRSSKRDLWPRPPPCPAALRRHASRRSCPASPIRPSSNLGEERGPGSASRPGVLLHLLERHPSGHPSEP